MIFQSNATQNKKAQERLERGLITSSHGRQLLIPGASFYMFNLTYLIEFTV
jgi:hypothetical protein